MVQSAFHRAVLRMEPLSLARRRSKWGSSSGRMAQLVRYAEAMRLCGVMLFVKDFAQMRAFYSELLRREPDSSSSDSYASYPGDGVAFTLHAIPEEIARGLASSPSPRESSSLKFSFSTSDVPAERARLESLGATILQRPWQNPDEAFDAADPEGNVFGVIRR